MTSIGMEHAITIQRLWPPAFFCGWPPLTLLWSWMVTRTFATAAACDRALRRVAATAALQSALGIVDTALAVLVFVAVGNPASGGPLAPELMSRPWRDVGWLLPTRRGTTMVRNITYFDGNDTTRALLVLAGYSLAGSLVVLALTQSARATGRLEAEASAGVAHAA